MFWRMRGKHKQIWVTSNFPRWKSQTHTAFREYCCVDNSTILETESQLFLLFSMETKCETFDVPRNVNTVYVVEKGTRVKLLKGRGEREHNTVALKTTRKVFPQHLHFRPKEIFRKFKSLICKQKMAPQLSFCFVRWSIAHLVCLLYCAPKICNFHHRRRYQRPYYHDECQQYSPHWWCGPGGR